MSERGEVPDDECLARRAAGGDGVAFETLIARHYDRIHHMAWRWLGRRDGAEDVAQTVCIKLGEAIRGFRGEAAFATWLYRVTYNATIDHIRQSQRLEATAPSILMALADRNLPPAPAADDGLEGEALWTAVRALPDQQRDAVLLVYAEDMSHAEAAQIMGCAEKTVSWHLHAARKRLKAHLETQG